MDLSCSHTMKCNVKCLTLLWVSNTLHVVAPITTALSSLKSLFLHHRPSVSTVFTPFPKFLPENQNKPQASSGHSKSMAITSSKENILDEGRRLRQRKPASQSRLASTGMGHPIRTFRRSNSLSISSQDHTTQIDYSYPDSSATTVHLHSEQTQYSNPHPANEIQFRGYANSDQVKSSHPSAVNGISVTRDQKVVGAQVSEDRIAI